MLTCEGISKEALVTNFLNRILKNDYKITLGVDAPIKNIEQKLKRQFWIFPYILLSDISDWEEFVSKKIRGSNGIIIMYDITKPESLNWATESIQKIKIFLDSVPPVLLVGNKLDLEENREVSKKQIKELIEDNKFSSSMEISLKTGENVEKTYVKLTKMMLRNYKPDYGIETKLIEVKKIVTPKESKYPITLIFTLIVLLDFIICAIMYYFIYII